MAEYGEIIFQQVSQELDHTGLKHLLERGSDDAITLLTKERDIPQTMIDELLLELDEIDQDWDVCYLDFTKPKDKPKRCRDKPFSIDSKKAKEFLNTVDSPIIISPQGRRKLLAAINKNKHIQSRIDKGKIHLLVKGFHENIETEALPYFILFLAIAITVLILFCFHSIASTRR